MEIHRITGKRFGPEDFNGKRLCWFHRETPHVCGLRVADVHPDGSFILWGLAVGLASSAAPGREGEIALAEESLDQQTVDKIGKAGAGALMAGCDFVIFEDSPRAAALCHVTQ